MPATSSGSTEIPAAREDENRLRVFPCESCGADLEFQIGAQSLQCSHCGFVKKLDIDTRLFKAACSTLCTYSWINSSINKFSNTRTN